MPQVPLGHAYCMSPNVPYWAFISPPGRTIVGQDLLALTPVKIIIIIYAVDPARAAMAR